MDAGYSQVLLVMDQKVTDTDNTSLLVLFSIKEFKEAIFSMHPNKSPGPDEFSPDFTNIFGAFLERIFFKIAFVGLSLVFSPPI